ncbi:DUF2752 domain-containing protein [uncultured Ruminococcus sp.]|jgi:hypothetical protein|uniref:DUF2752 domain-containing protein n=1 Tax=uncultured Ruminococcus sp. TaxID=165186 RepID=UPI0025D8F78E|nr:DUF2752 domain-containing protein [uncultured Ruminococcus sp.]
MSKRLRIFIAAGAPVLAAVILLLRNYIIGLKRFFPECSFHRLTGYWCSGCGNTRSVEALLHGHIFTAIRNNATMPFLSLLLILLYFENLGALFGRDIKLLPRKWLFWGPVIGIFIVYFIVRNFIPVLAPIS